MFSPDLKVGKKITNAEIAEIFDCSKVGNMRQTAEKDALILISDFTKGDYHDKWIGDVLHFTGYGKKGDQDIHKGQNANLCDSNRDLKPVFLFEMLDPSVYTYCGQVWLCDKPYMDMQPGEDKKDRYIWVFPLKPMHDEFFEKPPMFVFDTLEEYKEKVAAVEEEYAKIQSKMKKPAAGTNRTAAPSISTMYMPKPKEVIQVPDDIVGKQVKHKKYGVGTVTEVSGQNIVIEFESEGRKKLGYDVCVTNKLIEIL